MHTIAGVRTHSTCRYDEPVGFSALALRKSRYRSKLNMEKEISSLIQQFEKMCVDQQAHYK